MSPQNDQNIRSLLQGQNKFQRSVIIGLGMGLILSVGMNFYQVIFQKVSVVPNEVRRPYEIGGGTANKEYFIDQANYAIHHLATTSPDQVDFNNKVILKMADPDGYAELKRDLDAAALRIKKDKVSTVWTTRAEEVNDKDLQVVVKGKQKTYISDKFTSDKEKAFFVQFKSTLSGRIYVSKIEEVIKDDPASKRNSDTASNSNTNS